MNIGNKNMNLNNVNKNVNNNMNLNIGYIGNKNMTKHLDLIYDLDL